MRIALRPSAAALGGRQPRAVAPPAASQRAREGTRLVPLGSAAELAERGRTVVAGDGIDFLVLFNRRSFSVLINRCPHAGTRLDDARIRRGVLTCPMHGLRFQTSDGSPVASPGCRIHPRGPLAVFATEIVDGQLYAVVGAPEAR